MGKAGEAYVVFVAGGSAAGKGVGERKLRQQGILRDDDVRLSGEILLGDDPVYKIKKLTERHPEKTDPVLRARYYRLIDEKVSAALAQHKNIIIDDHMDNVQMVHAVLRDAKGAGYTTLLLGFSASPAAVCEVFDKLADETHLPPDYTWGLKSHKHFAGAFNAFASQFDLAALFFRELGEPGKVVYMHDGHSQQSEILDGEKYDIFKQWANANIDAGQAKDVLPETGAQEHRDIAGGNTAGDAPRTQEDGSFVQRIKGKLLGLSVG